jgi:ribosomal subunit interface protein
METIFFFKNMVPSEEEQLREYFLTKVPKIEKMLSHFSPDSVTLQVKGEKFQKHSAYDVELTMKSPLGTLTSQEASHMITKAVDLAKDRLMLQLKKNLTQGRRTHRSLKARSKMEMKIASPV